MLFDTVLVTGGAGFIGSQLVKRILPISNHIFIIDNLSTGQRESIPTSEKISFIHDSFINTSLLKQLLPKVDYIFHLACSNLIKSVEDLELDFYTNLYGGFVLLENTKKYSKNIKRFIYTSTASIYSEATVFPTDESYFSIKLPYAASKFSMEHYCDVYYHMYGLPISSLRLSNVYGPGQTTTNPYCGVVAKFFEASLQSKPLVVFGDGYQTRDFTYIEDVVDAILLCALDKKAKGELYNVGTGIETSIIDLAKQIREISGNKDLSIEFNNKRPIDIIQRRNIDSSKIKGSLNWVPKYPLYEGLKETLKWLNNKNKHRY